MAAQEDHNTFEIADRDEIEFAPESGNVAFCSGIDCWAFTLINFFASHLPLTPSPLPVSPGFPLLLVLLILIRFLCTFCWWGSSLGFDSLLFFFFSWVWVYVPQK